ACHGFCFIVQIVDYHFGIPFNVRATPLDKGCRDDMICFSTELALGDLYTLYKKMDKKTVNFLKENGTKIVFQILYALEFLQSHGIAHCDIKPANILINWEDENPQETITAKIADFGMATIPDIDPKGNSCKIMSPYYTAPEIIACSRNYNYGVDMW